MPWLSFVFSVPPFQLKNRVLPLPIPAFRLNVLRAGNTHWAFYINGKGPLKFIVDTAATRTSLFESTRIRLGLEEEGESAKIFVNGITASRLRPSVKIDTIDFGHVRFNDHQIVILQDWYTEDNKVDGILGLDVLGDLVMEFNHKTSRANLQSDRDLKQSALKSWRKIRLRDNPYSVEKYGLLFAYTWIGDKRVPTVLDTGSAFTALNWPSVKNTNLEHYKTDLFKDWVVQGAIGQFKPRMRVKITRSKNRRNSA